MNTITLYSPEEALAVIPHLLGFVPTHHAVVLGIDSTPPACSGLPDGACPILTVDLATGPLTEERARALAATLLACGVRRAVLAVYSDDAELQVARDGSEYVGAAEILWEALEERWGEAAELFLYFADPRGFMSVSGQLRPWNELQGSLAAAQFVYEGSAPTETPPEMAIIPQSPALRDAAEHVRAMWHMREAAADDAETMSSGEDTGGKPSTMTAGAACDTHGAGDMLTGTVGRLLHRRGDSALTAAEAGALAAVIDQVPLRDALLAWALAEVPLGMPLRPEEIMGLKMPHVVRADNVRLLLEAVAAYVPTAPVLATSAYLAWWLGMNSVAAARVQSACEIDPGYTLTRLLSEALDASVLPPWMTASEMVDN
ncbi:DUF4192 family protein [Neoactinobaculum massilliense]|uniref:DUF4192 family protein n=1 Tax=Neoactinobaculum massilliense TaxID=2364794 RepID=UPI0013DE538F|nr:DUF4192 family protein [Neoactinobaculum massilliense]